MSGICYIVGAVPQSSIDIHATEDDCIIAADGGYVSLRKLGIVPTVLIGDFDSLEGSICEQCISEAEGYGIPVIRFPSVKDDTDMALAVKYGSQKGYTRFIIYGALGGRLDHTMANIQMAAHMSMRGQRCELRGAHQNIYTVTDGEIILPAKSGGYISVFSHTDISEHVDIEGLKYEVSNISLVNSISLGVSNEYNGNTVRISVGKGTLVIIEEL